MIGQTIESRPAPPIGRGLALLLALALVGLAFAVGSPVPAVLAVLPLALAVVFHLGQPGPFRADVEEEGLRIEGRDELLRYDSIQGLKAARPSNPYLSGRKRYSIRLITADGDALIPAHLNVACDEVYTFLFHRLSSSGLAEVHPSLADFHRENARKHGPGRVWAFRARKRYGALNRPLLLGSLAVAATGVLWICAGVVLKEAAWGGVGGFVLFLGLLVALLAWLTAAYSKSSLLGNSREPAGLVISPEGLALVQGPLNGEIRWREVSSIKMRNGMLMLFVEGADIPIPDVYDRPMPLIHQLVMDYWEGRGKASAPEWRFDATRLEAAAEEGRDRIRTRR